MFVFNVGSLFTKYIRSGRNSELIINTNNILLKVMNDFFFIVVPCILVILKLFSPMNAHFIKHIKC
jgi:hypothetical protein